MASTVVPEVGSVYINSMSRDDFNHVMDIGWADNLMPVMQQSIRDYVDSLSEVDLRGVPRDFVQLALLVMIPHWIQSRAHPHQTDGWHLPWSVIIGSAIGDRLKRIREEARQKAFLEGLGQVVDQPPSNLGDAPNLTEALESRADLTPATKVNVLENALVARNRSGVEGPDGLHRINPLTFHRRSLEAARRFFEANPAVTVGHLLHIVDCCIYILPLPLPPEVEDDPNKVLRKCRDLSYLLVMLRKLVWTHHFEVSVDRFLNRKELFGPGPELESPTIGAQDPTPATSA